MIQDLSWHTKNRLSGNSSEVVGTRPLPLSYAVLFIFFVFSLFLSFHLSCLFTFSSCLLAIFLMTETTYMA